MSLVKVTSSGGHRGRFHADDSEATASTPASPSNRWAASRFASKLHESHSPGPATAPRPGNRRWWSIQMFLRNTGIDRT